jgi:hypothetical protein
MPSTSYIIYSLNFGYKKDASLIRNVIDTICLTSLHKINPLEMFTSGFYIDYSIEN